MNKSVFYEVLALIGVVPGTTYTTAPETGRSMMAMFLTAKVLVGAEIGFVVKSGLKIGNK